MTDRWTDDGQSYLYVALCCAKATESMPIPTKVELELWHLIGKPPTKFQPNIRKHRNGKSGKLV